MKVDGVDPIQLNKVTEFTQKTLVQESQRQDPKREQQERVLGREQQVVKWDGSNTEALDEAIKQMNKAAEAFNVELKFSVHEGTDRVMVQVVNKESQEIIREIPPERVLNMVAQIQTMIGIGLFVDSRR